jgi:outer membrane protein
MIPEPVSMRGSRQLRRTLFATATAAAWLMLVAAAAVAEPWTLTRVLDATRAGDPSVRAARAAGDAGRAQAAGNWALLSPHVTASYGFTRSDDPAMLFSQKLWQGRFTPADFAVDALNQPGATSARQWTLTVDQPLWNGAREILAPGMAARMNRAATQMERAAIADRLLAAAGAWVDAVAARENAVAADRALAVATAMRGAAAQRLRMGQVADVDTLRAAARSSEALVRALGAHRQLAVMLQRLSGMVQAPVAAEELASDDALAPIPPGDGARGELAAAHEGVLAAATQSREAALALLPSLNSRLAVSQYAPVTGDRWERRWMLAVSADLPLFDGGQRLNAWRAARAQAAQAKAGEAALARDLALNLAATRAQADVAVQRRDAAFAGRTAAEEALRLADARYRSGLLSLTDLLAADAEATAARASAIEAESDLVLTHVRLLHAMGELR